MYWQFHYPKRTTFYPPDYEQPGLGGCEASLVLLTRALAARGHQVEVFACCYKPGIYDGVHWRMAWELSKADHPDVAVAVRFEEALWPANAQAGTFLYWMLDDRTGGAATFLRDFAKRGQVVTASLAMREQLDLAGIRGSTTMIPLPVEIHRYRKPIEDRRPICLYSSMPNRGLDAALAIWPRIHNAVPDAQLWITGGWQLWGYTRSEAEDRWKQIIGTQPLPDSATVLGALSRSELIDAQQRAYLSLYPCRFPEMFCLSLAESAAAGTPAITSSAHALTERVQHHISGVLIDGDITDSLTRDQFTQATISLLHDPARRTHYAAAARKSVASSAPDAVAASWEGLLSQRTRGEDE